jgi:hypothetical protein
MIRDELSWDELFILQAAVLMAFQEALKKIGKIDGRVQKSITGLSMLNAMPSSTQHVLVFHSTILVHI